MSHVRQQLRESVASAVTGLALTGSRVFQSRVYPVQTTDLPCLVISTDGEDVEYLTIRSPSQQVREVIVRIEATARANTDLDDTLDAICQQVEIAIAGASLIAKSVQLSGTRIEINVLGDQPIGQATLIYRMKVYTLSNEPQTAL